MRFKASVTFEYLEQAPETVRAEIVAGNAHTGASRAVKTARKALPRRRPTSMVVLLEPVGGELAAAGGV